MQFKRCQFNQLDEALTRRLDGFSLFTSAGFAGLWTAAGGRPVYWTAEEDGRTLAALPGVEHGRGPLRRFQVMPDGLYANIVFDDPQEKRKDEIASGLFGAVVGYGYLKIHLSDYFNFFTGVTGAEKLVSRTTLVRIDAEDWEPPDPKIRSEIRKAGRDGAMVETFDASKHYDCFMALMRQTEQRHGRAPKYSPEFFRALAALARNDDRVVWKYVGVGGEAAASHIYFIAADTALNWQIYFNKKFSALKPNQYILYTTAKELAARGVRYLNLGSSPGDAAGLENYKNKWGGEAYEYPCYRKLSPLGKIL